MKSEKYINQQHKAKQSTHIWLWMVETTLKGKNYKRLREVNLTFYRGWEQLSWGGNICQPRKHTVEDDTCSLICSNNYLEVITHPEFLECLSIMRNNEEFCQKLISSIFHTKYMEFQDNRQKLINWSLCECKSSVLPKAS